MNEKQPRPPDQVPGIQVTDLKRAFGEVKAVDGVTFSAPASAVTALIGPNGSGKTTLLLMLAGLLAPDAGRAVVGGRDVVEENQQARGLVGWMPDAFGTWDALTCTEILTSFAHAYRIPRDKSAVHVRQVLEQVHLSEFADSPARVLSRGQKQRLGLARALVHDPQVLLLDEPASGLDPRSRIELRDLLRGLAADGKTVLVSSHVLSELEELHDHAVFLSRGRSVDASSSPSQETRRGWRVEALDPASLRSFLDTAGIPWVGQPEGEVVIQLAGQQSAHELLRAMVLADVAVHTITPVSGRLEETYLALDEERI